MINLTLYVTFLKKISIIKMLRNPHDMPIFNFISHQGNFNKKTKRKSFLQGLGESSVLTKLTVSIVFDLVWGGKGGRDNHRLTNQGIKETWDHQCWVDLKLTKNNNTDNINEKMLNWLNKHSQFYMHIGLTPEVYCIFQTRSEYVISYFWFKMWEEYSMHVAYQDIFAMRKLN